MKPVKIRFAERGPLWSVAHYTLGRQRLEKHLSKRCLRLIGSNDIGINISLNRFIHVAGTVNCITAFEHTIQTILSKGRKNIVECSLHLTCVFHNVDIAVPAKKPYFQHTEPSLHASEETFLIIIISATNRHAIIQANFSCLEMPLIAGLKFRGCGSPCAAKPLEAPQHRSVLRQTKALGWPPGW